MDEVMKTERQLYSDSNALFAKVKAKTTTVMFARCCPQEWTTKMYEMKSYSEAVLKTSKFMSQGSLSSPEEFERYLGVATDLGVQVPGHFYQQLRKFQGQDLIKLEQCPSDGHPGTLIESSYIHIGHRPRSSSCSWYLLFCAFINQILSHCVG